MAIYDGPILPKSEEIKVNPINRETMQNVKFMNTHNVYCGTFRGNFKGGLKISSIDVNDLTSNNITVNSGKLHHISAFDPSIYVNGISSDLKRINDISVLDNEVFEILPIKKYFYNVTVSEPTGLSTDFISAGEYDYEHLSGNDQYEISGQPLCSDILDNIMIIVKQSGDKWIGKWVGHLKHNCSCHTPDNHIIEKDLIIEDNGNSIQGSFDELTSNQIYSFNYYIGEVERKSKKADISSVNKESTELKNYIDERDNHVSSEILNNVNAVSSDLDMKISENRNTIQSLSSGQLSLEYTNGNITLDVFGTNVGTIDCADLLSDNYIVSAYMVDDIMVFHNNLSSMLTDLSVSLSGFTKRIETASGDIMSSVGQVSGDLMETISDISDNIETLITNISNGITSEISTISSTLSSELISTTSDISTNLSTSLTTVISNVSSDVLNITNNTISSISSEIISVLTNISDDLKTVSSVAENTKISAITNLDRINNTDISVANISDQIDVIKNDYIKKSDILSCISDFNNGTSTFGMFIEQLFEKVSPVEAKPDNN